MPKPKIWTPDSTLVAKVIPATKFSVGRMQGGKTQKITTIVLHTAETSEITNSAEGTAGFFAGGSGGASASTQYCLTPETPVLTRDLRWVPIGELEVGDELVGVEEFSRDVQAGRKYIPSTVTGLRLKSGPCKKITLADGRTVTSTDDHMWLANVPTGHTSWGWMSADALRVGDDLMVPMDVWPQERTDGAAWMAGFIDGEGHINKVHKEIGFGQNIGLVYDEAISILDQMEIPYRTFIRTANGHSKFRVLHISGMGGTLRLLGSTRPVRMMDRSDEVWVGRSLKSRKFSGKMTITSIEDVGEQEVVSISTSSRTFIANGIVSHNCLDIDGIIQCVKEKDRAYGAVGFNYCGIHIEQAGRAAQGPAQWADAYSSAMLKNMTIPLVADICKRRGISPVFLTATDLLAGRLNGITTHAECTKWAKAKKIKTRGHTDPGKDYPMATVIAGVRKLVKK